MVFTLLVFYKICFFTYQYDNSWEAHFLDVLDKTPDELVGRVHRFQKQVKLRFAQVFAQCGFCRNSISGKEDTLTISHRQLAFAPFFHTSLFYIFIIQLRNHQRNPKPNLHANRQSTGPGTKTSIPQCSNRCRLPS